jgi:methylenetetrahydrofolate dehydrogenase (NADP+)/methenyltetrahydrofolate cyclohydrolase
MNSFSLSSKYMHQKLIDGKALAEKILARTTTKIKQLKQKGQTPKLAVVLVGENPASEIYVKKKGEAAMNIGMDFILHRFPKTIKLPELLKALEELQHNPTLSGLIIQLPLPKHLPVTTVINAVKPEYDVDCLTDVNFGKLILNTYTIEPPTAGAIMEILNSLKLNLAGKHVCVVGTGALVGKPVAIMLMNKEATVTTCNSSTKKQVKYREKLILGDTSVIFHDVGHIFGSAFIEINAEGKKIVFSGDVGNVNVPILCDTEALPGNLDVLVCESTYDLQKGRIVYRFRSDQQFDADGNPIFPSSTPSTPSAT